MNINWKARIENKTFWISLVGAIILLLQQLKLFTLANYIPNNYADIINSIFAILTMLGITIDTSTPGISDCIKQPLEANTEVKNVVDNSIGTANQNTVQVSTDTTASAKIQVANPNNVQVLGQEVNHISADKPQ